MAIRDARKIYNDLSRYFGLRSKDAYMSAIDSSPAKGSGGDSKVISSKAKFLNEIFGDGSTFKTDKQLSEWLTSYNENNVEKDVCVTPGGKSDVPAAILNKIKDDQGWGAPESGAAGNYQLLRDLQIKGAVPENNITAYQIFPATGGVDITDTEIITLFLSSLTTLEMTRAVPYIDIGISVGVGAGQDKKTGNFTKNAPVSLGRFLAAGDTEKALRGKFGGTSESAATFASDKKANLQTVASMEVFTTPQTLVDASDVSYNEAAGGRIDAFRPFLNLEGIDITTTASGFGTIAYKTASMTLKLFDRGRLADIAPLVSPQRKGNIQFYITYGWAHPDGTLIQRPSSSESGSRIGELIDAMRISEAYIVTNSSFSFGGEGIVSINVELAMVGSDVGAASNILSMGSDDSIESLVTLIEGIQKKLRDIRGSAPGIDISQVASASSLEGSLSLSDKDKKSMRKVAQQLKGAGGNLSALGTDLSKLLKPDEDGKLQKAQNSIVGKVTEMTDILKSTPDPFLRPTATLTKKKLGQHGVKADTELVFANIGKKQRYVSLGKLMMYWITKGMTDKNTDIQVVFTPFNASAGGMYDHNIAQFPIEISDLDKFLKAEAKKNPKLSLNEALQFLEKYFLSFQGNSAYGLDKIYVPDKRDDKTKAAKYQNAAKKAMKAKGIKFNYNNLMKKNLGNIYRSKRFNPTFVMPNVTMSISTRLAGDKSGKNITRITFFDAAGGQIMPLIDTFNKAARQGHFIEEDLSGPPGVRGARHGEAIKSAYKVLRQRKLVTTLAESLDDDPNLDKFIEKFPEKKRESIKEKLMATRVFSKDTARSKLKEIFFEFAPSLIYGTAGSGILTADLSSQQNDALTSIALAGAFSGKDGGEARKNIDLPLMIHPTTLKLTTFGCPFFRFSQKFFVDLGTNTSADNFYAVVGISHSIKQGDFKTSLDMIQTDAYGSFVSGDEEIQNAITTIELALASPKKKKKKKN